MYGGVNRLIHEQSLYLRQHARNPVDWYPWGEEAFDRARSEDKPILVSVGYSACHWCHVMEAESFEDARVAAFQNAQFVSIKVDREERPDVDRVYMEACQILTGSGGWPLNVFLLPDGRPFFAGTYFPKEARYGRLGWLELLKRIHALYQEHREEVISDAAQLTEMIRRESAVVGAEAVLGDEVLKRFVQVLGPRFDQEHGGLGRAPKFPNVPILETMLWCGVAFEDAEALRRVRQALSAMAEGGLFDHLGGGFHRYSVDQAWAVPHFEKMLYDNGLLLRLYAEITRIAPSVRDHRIIEATASYLQREMTGEEGLFYAAQDADSDGEEGRFFVWEPTTVEAVLGEDSAFLCDAFGVSQEGNFEGGRSVLSCRKDLAALQAVWGGELHELQERIERGRRLLWQAREQRPKPLRDEKRITAWNALAIQGLARSGFVLQQASWCAQAERAARVYLEAFQKDGYLHRLAYDAPEGLQWKTLGFLDDYAFLALAWMDLYTATGDALWISAAKDLCAAMKRRFLNQDGALQYNDTSAEALIVSPQSALDEAVPSALGSAALAFLRSALWTGEPADLEVADAILRSHALAIQRGPSAFSSLLRVHLHRLQSPRMVVAVFPAASSDAEMAAVRATLASVLTASDLCLLFRDGQAPSEIPAHLWKDRPSRDGRCTFYLCDTAQCFAPTHQVSELALQPVSR